MTTGVLALWMDIDSQAEDECTEWYIREHVPDRIAVPTYVRARRFKALAGAGYLATYDATTAEGLAHPGYMALLDAISDWGLRMRGAFSGTARETFRCLARAGSGEGAFVATVRFGADDSARAGLLAGLAAACPALAGRRGILSAEVWEAAPDIRARMDARRITGTRDAHVAAAVLIEGTSPATIDAVLADGLDPGGLARRGARDLQIDRYAFQLCSRKPTAMDPTP